MAASDIYKEAIDKAKSDETLDVLPALYIHYSHHLYAVRSIREDNFSNLKLKFLSPTC